MYIYFAQGEITRLIKIGHSKNIDDRLDTIQANSPDKVKLLKVIEGNRSLERALHKQFDSVRSHREWFYPSRGLMAYIKALKGVKPKQQIVSRAIKKIQRAAHYFAHNSRDVQNIADAFGVSHYAVRKWAKTPDWHNALDAFGYEGDRGFSAPPKRNAPREQGETFTAVYEAYMERLRAGIPKHTIARLVEAETGVVQQKIRRWARWYNWKGQA